MGTVIPAGMADSGDTAEALSMNWRSRNGRTDIAFREMARAAITKWNREVRPFLPLCGAKTRSTGLPCRQIGLANGRCRWHGGATPKGDKWHRAQWPADRRKLHRKLGDRAKAESKRRERVGAMSKAERAAHADWQRTHRPGSARERATDRERRRRDREAALFRELENRPETPPSPELIALQEQRQALLARLEDLKRNPEDGE